MSIMVGDRSIVRLDFHGSGRWQSPRRRLQMHSFGRHFPKVNLNFKNPNSDGSIETAGCMDEFN
jgi:hypothetical protein